MLNLADLELLEDGEFRTKPILKKIIEVSTIFIIAAKYYNLRALYFFLAKNFSNGKVFQQWQSFSAMGRNVSSMLEYSVTEKKTFSLQGSFEFILHSYNNGKHSFSMLK